MDYGIAMDKKMLDKINKIQKRIEENDPNNEIPFSMKMIMAMGEFSKELYGEGNNNE